MRALMGGKGVLLVAPDELSEPKQVRDDLLQARDGKLAQGLGYNARLKRVGEH
jgi:hypothetical protein